MSPSPPFPSPSQSSAHPGIIGEHRGVHLQNAEQPQQQRHNGEYLLHLLQTGGLQNVGNGERFHQQPRYNFCSQGIVVAGGGGGTNDIPMAAWDPAVAALGPSHSYNGLGGSERDYLHGLYASQCNSMYGGGWPSQNPFPQSSASPPAVDLRVVQSRSGAVVVPAQGFSSLYVGLADGSPRRSDGANPPQPHHLHGFVTDSDISPNSTKLSVSSSNGRGSSAMMERGGPHQQFYGDGAELMKLLQISSSKVGGSVDSDPKSEKQVNLMVTAGPASVQKSSPAILHGPIGPPKRAEPPGLSSAHDLLGRFWPAPASCSNGNQEMQQNNVKAFGLPYKGSHANFGSLPPSKDGGWWGEHASEKKFDSFGGDAVAHPSLSRLSPQLHGSASSQHGLTENFELHERKGLLGGWGGDLYEEEDLGGSHFRKNRSREDLYIKSAETSLNSAHQEALVDSHSAAVKESELEYSREIVKGEGIRGGGGRRSSGSRGEAVGKRSGRNIVGQWVAVAERQRDRDGIELNGGSEGAESGSDKGSNSAGTSCKEESITVPKEGGGSQKIREELKRRRGQQQEWRMKAAPSSQSPSQPLVQSSTQSKNNPGYLSLSDTLELPNGIRRASSPPKVRPLAAQVDHPGLPSSVVPNSSAPGSAVEDSKKLIHDRGGQLTDTGKGIRDESLAKEEEEELREAFAGYLDLVDEPEVSHQPRFSHPSGHGEVDFDSRLEQVQDFRRPPQRSLAIPSLRPDMRYRPDLAKFSAQMLALYQALIPPEEEERKRRQFLFNLEQLVAREWPGARLFLFGSCANAFGVCNSDIDVCLSVDDEQLSKADLVLKMAAILRSANMQNVQALTHARVPIVKFMDGTTGMACDICVNNRLAVVNSKLLHDYSQVDVRLRQLAFLVKHWAKRRQVNETYRGTLSSYAYVLMCIHFLQQRKPTVLPCLQEMRPTYRVTVGNIECAYFDQVETLQHYGSTNKETLGELLTSFFEYWAFRHDYNRAVVSVRTGGYLSKDEKEWTRRIGNERHLICIEDPFETSHDLGRVVDRHSIRVLRDEFHRAAKILRHDLNPCTTLFEPFVREKVT